MSAAKRSLNSHAAKIARELGAPVFPVRVTKKVGAEKSHKLPLITGWQNGSAVNTREDIDRIFPKDATHAGIPTGDRSGLLVVDLDGDSAQAWRDAHRELLPETRTQPTQRGVHLYYRIAPGLGLRNSASKLAEKIDIRADGGYVVDWSLNYEPSGEIIDAPQALVGRLRSLSKVITVDFSPSEIREGSRNNDLTSYAGRLRRGGATRDEILAALRIRNSERCDPELSERELQTIAGSVGRYESPHDRPPWEPPALHTYGAGFDPASIPLRQWLLGNRRSIGEVTIDAGPPGVNKSTLLVTDAISIVTGKQILADVVHAVGHVLMFVGEDARRDVEVRIAGVLQRYGMTPAQLGDRLHMVYLSEVDPSAYSLAQMIDSAAVINRQMLEWIAAFPGGVAAFIDPIAAWHHILENDNPAMKVLCTELRRTAVQANIHIGFDHHTTKASQLDLEFHVGNIAALRGAYMGGDARWMFTLAKLKPETARLFGIPDEDRWLWRRLDPLKASYGPDSGNTRLLKIDAVTIANGENAAVLTEGDAESLRVAASNRQREQATDRRRDLTDALIEMLRERRPRSLTDAGGWFLKERPQMFLHKGIPLSTAKRLGEKLQKEIGDGLLTTYEDRRAWVECRTSGEGHAARWTVDISFKERK